MAGRLWAAGLFAALISPLAPIAQEASPKETEDPAEISRPEEVAELVRQTFTPDPGMRRYILSAFEVRGLPDVVPGLILVMRFIRDDGAIDQTLSVLTGEPPGKGWAEWMLWQQAHPEILPFAGFDAFKADTMAVIDPDFRLFLQPGVAHEVRLEEIVWGGVKKDGIPALVDPKLITAGEATWLTDDELVFGVEIAGDARAWPLRILDWHEMLNDTVGGVPVALAYCTLCGSGILYDRRVPGRDEPFEFGSSGFLYRSNKLMYDQQTHSLWNQFTGRPVVGPLTGSGIELDVLPVTIASWRDWRAGHPDTKVLSLDTGYRARLHAGPAVRRVFREPGADVPGAGGGRSARAQGLRVRPARARQGVVARRVRRRQGDQRRGGRARRGADRRCRDAHGARLPVRRPAFPGDRRSRAAHRRRRGLADRGGCPGRAGRRAARAAAGAHRLLVRLAGFFRRRAARWRGRLSPA